MKNTIVRTFIGGYVVELETVKETVIELRKTPGRYTIDDIKDAINNQLLDRKEHLTRKMVVRAMVKLVGKSNKRAIDKHR